MSVLEEIAEQIRGCTRCRLCEGRTQAVPGVGPEDAEIMFIGEAPGRDEDTQGEPFVGPAGQMLTQLLAGIGVDRGDVYITNICKCRPPSNRTPRPDEVEACREYLDGQIAAIRPTLTLLDDATLSVMKLNGTVLERHHLTFVPLIHPAAGLHQDRMRQPIQDGFRRLGEILTELR